MVSQGDKALHIRGRRPMQGSYQFDSALCCSDIPTKVFISSLNDQRERSEKFILEDLDNKHLFVQPTIIDEMEKQLQKFQEENTYAPPRKDG